MFSQSPYLRSHRPSATTVEFTVSTARRRNNLAVKSLHVTLLLVRITLGLGILLLGYAKWNDKLAGRASSQSDELFSNSWIGQLAIRTVEGTRSWILLSVIFVVAYGIFSRGYTEESLLVIRGLGVQTSTTASTYLSGSQTRFIPTELIQDIFIHEAFVGFSVRFYLAIIVANEEEAVVVFPNILPKRSIIEEVWRGSRECLYEPKS